MAETGTDTAPGAADDSPAGRLGPTLVGLSFVAGGVEAVCFLGLFQTFTTFITGTTVFLSIELLRPQGQYVTKLVVIVSFLAFTVFWIWVIRLLRRRRRRLRAILSAVQGALLLLFMAVAALLSPLAAADAPETTLAAFVSVTAMSLHSAHFYALLGDQPATLSMTANMTKFVMTAMDHAKARRRGDAAAQAATRARLFRLRIYPSVYVAFFLGVACGAWGLAEIGFFIVAVPAATLFLIAAISYDQFDGGT